jgi:glycosyltransferase involved in cell wall biosynthesis
MLLLSIITPVYNNVNYISIAIDNYLSQACADSELIIVDGGSSDGTVDVIAAYAKIHVSITWISEKDKGQSDAMNKGIKLAKGKYISFLNVDDYYSSGCLQEVTEILTNNPNIQYLVGNCNVWNQHGDLIYVNRPSKVQKWHVFSGYHFSVNPTAYFYQKSLHAQVGYYSLTNHYTMDLEMIFRFRKVVKFQYFPKIWGNFRLLPNAKTFEDQLSNQLELRKMELVKLNLKELSFYLQLRVHLYRFRRTYLPIIVKGFYKLFDKVSFELNHFLIKKK